MTQVDAVPVPVPVPVPLPAEAVPASRPGRRRDPSRDTDILQAALDVLAETGYDGMTIDMVAARAGAGKATVYRRWSSKAELVVDAVACMKRGELDPDHLPDTGTLRGDLVAMIKTPAIADTERKLRVMAGLMPVLARDPGLAVAVNAAIVEPRAAINRTLMRRAADRGEISPDADIDTVALVTPSMAAYRVLILRRPVDREFLLSLIDGVVLPALGVAALGVTALGVTAR